MMLLAYATLTALLFLGESCGVAAVRAGGQTDEWGAKIGMELVTLYEQYTAHLNSRNRGPFRSTDPIVPVIDDRVLIDAVASGDVNSLKSELISLGMREAVAVGRIVSGQLPISAIPAMGYLPSLKFARAAAASLHGR